MFFKKKRKLETKEIIDDDCFIKDIKHISCGDWHQFDILLASQSYGWSYMVDMADYMSHMDLQDISTLTVSLLINNEEQELVEEYRANGNSVKKIPQLNNEQGALSIGGISQTLHEPLKIVWFNQTNVIRIFGITNDEIRIRKYVETLVRRNFNTGDEKKLGKSD